MLLCGLQQELLTGAFIHGFDLFSQSRNLDILSVGLIASVPALLAGFATILSGILLNKFFKNTEKYYAAGGMLLTTVFLFLMII